MSEQPQNNAFSEPRIPEGDVTREVVAELNELLEGEDADKATAEGVALRIEEVSQGNPAVAIEECRKWLEEIAGTSLDTEQRRELIQQAEAIALRDFYEVNK